MFIAIYVPSLENRGAMWAGKENLFLIHTKALYMDSLAGTGVGHLGDVQEWLGIWSRFQERPRKIPKWDSCHCTNGD